MHCPGPLNIHQPMRGPSTRLRSDALSSSVAFLTRSSSLPTLAASSSARSNRAWYCRSIACSAAASFRAAAVQLARCSELRSAQSGSSLRGGVFL
jgi:hypothetical protein